MVTLPLSKNQQQQKTALEYGKMPGLSLETAGKQIQQMRELGLGVKEEGDQPV